MPSAIMQQASITKNGTCPHGAPLGACPICNGMGGGGIKRADHTAKPGEMSWAECAAIGAMLRAQKNARLQKEQDYVSFAQRLADFNTKMMNIIQRTIDLTGAIANKFPKIISKPVNFIINTFALGGLKLIKAIPNIISNIATAISQKFTDISDKISAVIGEIKTALSKKIGEPLNNLKKKLKSLFSIFETQDIENEDKEFDDTKKIFQLKTFIHKMYNKLKKTEEELSK